MRRPEQDRQLILGASLKHLWNRKPNPKMNVDNAKDWRSKMMWFHARIHPTPLHLEEQDPEASKPRPRQMESSRTGPPMTWDVRYVFFNHGASAQ